MQNFASNFLIVPDKSALANYLYMKIKIYFIFCDGRIQIHSAFRNLLVLAHGRSPVVQNQYRNWLRLIFPRYICISIKVNFDLVATGTGLKSTVCDLCLKSAGHIRNWAKIEKKLIVFLPITVVNYGIGFGARSTVGQHYHLSISEFETLY